MTTIVEFRMPRNGADDVRPWRTAAPLPPRAPGDPVTAGAEIILMPLTWLKQLGQGQPRKPLKRRFGMREVAPA